MPKSKGKGGKGSSKAPKSGKKGKGSSKSPHSKGGKGSKSSKSPKSGKKSSKSVKSSKSPKSYKCSKKGKGHGCIPTSSPIAINVSTPMPTKNPVNIPSTLLPTPSLSLSCSELSRAEKIEIIKQYLLEITPENILNDGKSAQFEAAQFMYEQDLPCPTVIERTSVVQRFSLAVLYYSTEGDNWKFCGENGGCVGYERFLSEKSECKWYGIECENNEITKIDFELSK